MVYVSNSRKANSMIARILRASLTEILPRLCVFRAIHRTSLYSRNFIFYTHDVHVIFASRYETLSREVVTPLSFMLNGSDKQRQTFEELTYAIDTIVGYAVKISISLDSRE